MNTDVFVLLYLWKVFVTVVVGHTSEWWMAWSFLVEPSGYYHAVHSDGVIVLVPVVLGNFACLVGQQVRCGDGFPLLLVFL